MSKNVHVIDSDSQMLEHFTNPIIEKMGHFVKYVKKNANMLIFFKKNMHSVK